MCGALSAIGYCGEQAFYAWGVGEEAIDLDFVVGGRGKYLVYD
jgi:hypothetical protein